MLTSDARIPAYHLRCDSRLLDQLNEDVKAHRSIPATLGFHGEFYQIELAYRGAHTRQFAKKSFQITIVPPQLFRGAREFHLNAEFVDPSYMRNKLSFDFFTQIGSFAPQTEHVLLYLNDECLGIYLKIEAVDDRFLAARNLPAGPIYYAVNAHANFSLFRPKTTEAKAALEAGYQRKLGTAADDGDLRELIFRINATPPALFAHVIEKWVDIPQYLRWLAGAVCTQNLDGFLHNYALYRHGENKRFFIIPWDYEATWGRDVNGHVLAPANLRIQGFNTLTARLLDVPVFRAQYVRLLRSILDTTFTVAHLRPHILALHDTLRPFVSLDPYKQDVLATFATEPAFICAFIEERNQFLRQSLEAFEHPRSG
ncbi:CotH kinase family protein [Brevibacillus sp. SAFN-007a]|uniref:CotH kinase family protein n=1 Tax=Brevibacillus sp. SAFN-007a TaxID=3436862 RepID=UPI003F7ED790